MTIRHTMSQLHPHLSRGLLAHERMMRPPMLSLLLLSVCALLNCFHGVANAIPPTPITVETHPSFLHLAADQQFSAEELKTITVFERATKSVAYITNTTIRRDFWSLNTFEVPHQDLSGTPKDTSSPIFTSCIGPIRFK